MNQEIFKNREIKRSKKMILPFSAVRFAVLALVISVFGINTFAQKETPPAGAPPKPFIFPKQETYKLSNGMSVTLVQYGSVPKVAVQAWIRTNSYKNKAEQNWISDAVAALLKEGTATRSAEQIARESAEMGGSISAVGSAEKTNIGGEVLSDFDTKFIDLLADIILNPKFAADDLEKYRANRIRELTLSRVQPGVLAREKMFETIFSDHPYGVSQTEEMVKSYRLENLRKYYDDKYGAARTTLYVVGQFNTTAVKSAIEKNFGKWRRGSEATRNVPVMTAKRSLTIIERPNAPQSTIMLGMPAVSPSQDDFIKFQVLNSLLGGSFASRITSNIRENKGYTYSPYSYVWNRYKTGFWIETADVTSESTGASIKEILYEIDRLRKEPPSNEELQGIKNYLIGIYVLMNSTRTGIIGELENQNYNELDKNYLDTYIQKIQAVTPRDIQETAAKYLSEDKMTIVVVGDKAKITEQLKPYNQ